MKKGLIREFWSEVGRILKERGIAQREAAARIREYREGLAAHGVTDMVYHRDPEEIADDLAQPAAANSAPSRPKRKRAS